MELTSPAQMEHVTVNGRNLWHYLFQTTIGDLHIVQHEVKVEMNIVDDYMGWSNAKAEQAFHRMATRMLQDKE